MEYKEGNIIKCIVSGVEPYGIFVKIGEEYSGLIHISEISNKYVQNISDYVKINEIIYAKILIIDKKNFKMNLSIKDISYKMKSIGKRQKIVETKRGFSTLAYKLPYWIEENLKNNKKFLNSIDK